jgi:hypothetical protein
VAANKEAKCTRCHIPSANKEALTPAGARLDQDAILNEPAGIQEKGQRLLAIGENEIVDEEDKLRDWLAFSNPRGYPPGQENEEEERGEEGEKTQDGDGIKTTSQGFW